MRSYPMMWIVPLCSVDVLFLLLSLVLLSFTAILVVVDMPIFHWVLDCRLEVVDE